MSRFSLAVLVAVVVAQPVLAADWLVGVENDRFTTGVTGDFLISHSSSAVTAERSVNENLKLRCNLGSVISTLDNDGTALITGDGLYALLGASLEQELTAGGGMFIDLSYSTATVKASGDELSFDRTAALFAYVFGKGDRARVYAGPSYNTYTADYSVGSADFEADTAWSAVVGIRHRTESSYGLIEARIGGEMGMRVALAFGF